MEDVGSTLNVRILQPYTSTQLSHIAQHCTVVQCCTRSEYITLNLSGLQQVTFYALPICALSAERH